MRIMVSGTTRSLYRLVDDYRDNLGVLIEPHGGMALQTIAKLGLPWVADNGAFLGLDHAKWLRLLAKIHGASPRWVVVPDRPRDAVETLRLWGVWSPVLEALGLPRAFVLQDGQEDHELPLAEAYFIGGGDWWRESLTMRQFLRDVVIPRGQWLHMGRVNSDRRIRCALDLGCDSIDGTGYSRWGDRWLQSDLEYLRDLERTPRLFA